MGCMRFCFFAVCVSCLSSHALHGHFVRFWCVCVAVVVRIEHRKRQITTADV